MALTAALTCIPDKLLQSVPYGERPVVEHIMSEVGVASSKKKTNKPRGPESADGKEWLYLADVLKILGVKVYKFRRLMAAYDVETRVENKKTFLYSTSDILALRDGVAKERAELMNIPEASAYLGTTKDGLARLEGKGYITSLYNKLGRKAFKKAELTVMLKRLNEVRECYSLTQIADQLAEEGIEVDIRMLFYYLKKQDTVKPQKDLNNNNVYRKRDYRAIKKLVKDRQASAMHRRRQG